MRQPDSEMAPSNKKKLGQGGVANHPAAEKNREKQIRWHGNPPRTSRKKKTGARCKQDKENGGVATTSTDKRKNMTN